MKDLIERQKAIDAIEQLHDKPNAWLDCAVEALEKMPSAQPDLDEVYAHAETEAEARFHAEIIACGDCKHWICHERRCGYWNHGVKPLDWCCHAERRTDG